MINEKLEYFNINSNKMVLSPENVTDSYKPTNARNKVFMNWENSHKAIQLNDNNIKTCINNNNNIQMNDESIQMPIISNVIETTIETNAIESENEIKTQTISHQINESSDNYMDVINSVAINCDQEIEYNVKNNKLIDNLDIDLCHKEFLNEIKFNSTNDLNSIQNSNEIKIELESNANISLLDLNSCLNNNNNNINQIKQKRKRINIEKSFSPNLNSNINSCQPKNVSKKNKSPDEKSKTIMKVKLNFELPKNLSSNSINDNCISPTDMTNECQSNDIYSDKTSVEMINNNDIDSKIKKYKIKQNQNQSKRRERPKNKGLNNLINSFDSNPFVRPNPFENSFQDFLKNSGANVSDNKEETLSIPQIKLKSQIVGRKVLKKSRGIKIASILKNGSYLGPFQSFVERQTSTTSTGLLFTNNKQQIKYFPKKKSDSRILAEKAVKKSRRRKSAKPLVVKNLFEQKSFIEFCCKKFPPIKEGVPFIQDRSCKDFETKISLCLDCEVSKKVKDDSQFCRFFQYRTLIENNNTLSVYAFAEPGQATEEDSKIWLPRVTFPHTLDEKTAQILLIYVAKHFCKMHREENEVTRNAISLTWKKPVKGIRELCDVCQTTIFNTHWVCPTCGYAVCIDCYKLRLNNRSIICIAKRNHDEFGWLLCSCKEKHDIKKFHLALFMTQSVFGLVNNVLHTICSQFLIIGNCDCGKLMGNCFDVESSAKSSYNFLHQRYHFVPHEWFCDNRLLVLKDPKCVDNLNLFQLHWIYGEPVMVENVHLKLNPDLWTPQSFNRDFGKQTSRLVNCMNGDIIPKRPMRDFWNGFEDINQRLIDQETGDAMLLKLKDWPPNAEFRDMLPRRFDDLMDSLPLREYTRFDGIRNLSSRLPEFFVRPDLGPKMYSAYGSVMHPDKGTTNLHLDMTDAINVMIYVGIAQIDDMSLEEHMNEANEALLKGGCDQQMVNRVIECGGKVGALWHIFRANDSNKIRKFLTEIAIERNQKIEPNTDPIHDQSWYLDEVLLKRLYEKYRVKGYAIAQCLGDAILIPAGAPHQVRNVHSCIKVAGEFVSPENIEHSLSLTHEFRKLSNAHNNHEDKLQIKNIIYHSVKDAITRLWQPIFPVSIPVSRDVNTQNIETTVQLETQDLNQTSNQNLELVNKPSV